MNNASLDIRGPSGITHLTPWNLLITKFRTRLDCKTMSQHKTAIIIGGGVAGPAAALSLTRAGVKCTVYELRDGPATIGGAINLTPNALRFLDYVGILEDALKLGCPTEVIEIFSVASGKRLGDLPFGSKARHGYSSLRIGRTNLQRLLLDAVRDAGVEVHFSKKLVRVEEDEDSITAIFEDGTSATGDVLLGCDGIHSAVRKSYVEPTRQPSYTGISSAYGMTPTSAITQPIHFSAAAMNSSCNGSLLTVYCNAEKTTIYVAAVMEVPECQGDDGWRIKGKVAEETRGSLLRRFESEKLPCIKEMTGATEDLFFYPVFTLSKGGLWHRGRALLIGDASHAVSFIVSRKFIQCSLFTRCLLVVTALAWLSKMQSSSHDSSSMSNPITFTKYSLVLWNFEHHGLIGTTPKRSNAGRGSEPLAGGGRCYENMCTGLRSASLLGMSIRAMGMIFLSWSCSSFSSLFFGRGWR